MSKSGQVAHDPFKKFGGIAPARAPDQFAGHLGLCLVEELGPVPGIFSMFSPVLLNESLVYGFVFAISPAKLSIAHLKGAG
jgi:hypothetical protein